MIDNSEAEELTTACSWLIRLLLLLIIILPKNRAPTKQSTTTGRWLLSLVLLLTKQPPSSWLRRSRLPKDTGLGCIVIIVGAAERSESACALLGLGLAEDAPCSRLLLLLCIGPKGTSSTTKRASATKATSCTSCNNSIS